MKDYILSILVPIYNEEKTIVDMISRLEATKKVFLETKETNISNVEIIVINDGSIDSTSEYIAKYTNIKIIDLKENVGYGKALKIGFDEAKGDYIAFLDSDGTYRPEELIDLYSSMLSKNGDIIVGSRFLGRRLNMPVHRYIGNNLTSFFFSFISNKKITDVTSGMRLLKKETFRKFRPLPDGLDFSTAITVESIGRHCAYLEIPIRYEERIAKSKLNPVVDSSKIFFTLIRYSFIYFKFKIILLAIFLIIMIGTIAFL